MRLVIIESPYAGEVAANRDYARAAVCDCLQRGESPLASHLLLTQRGILDDANPAERLQGIKAGLAWYAGAQASVFYLDRGMSHGMRDARRYLAANHPTLAVEYRFTAPLLTNAERMALPFWFRWEAPFAVTSADSRQCETPLGRLAIDRTARAPNWSAPLAVTLNGRVAAYYATREAARAGAERFFNWLAGHAPDEVRATFAVPPR
jgi:hypothetical protein